MRRQFVIGAFGWTDIPEEHDHAAGNFRRHGRAAGNGVLQTLQQANWRCFLQQVAAGAGAKRVKDAFVVVINREHQQQQIGIALFQNAYPFDAGHAGQADVAEHYVRKAAANPGEGVFHRAVGARALKAFSAANEHRQTIADLAAVFDDGDLDD